jgi:hypothetical protein
MTGYIQLLTSAGDLHVAIVSKISKEDIIWTNTLKDRTKGRNTFNMTGRRNK